MTRSIALLLLLIAVPARAEDKPLPQDPSIVMGRLPNGMRYWIRPNRTPKGKVSMLMHVHSGSLNETDEQRGLAHFLEHMAFNGSKHFPPGEMVKFFESLGMSFGQHQNAFTGFGQTTYMMHLPDVADETLDKVFVCYTDVADRLLLLEEEIEKERGVILEEKRSRDGVGQRIGVLALQELLPGSRLAERIPIGTEPVIREAKRDRFVDYYRAWYRPDNTTLIVCGDVDADAMRERIEKAFSGWKGPESPRAHADPGVKPHEGLRAVVLADPELTQAELGVSTIDARLPYVTEADFRRELVNGIATWIVNRRYRQQIQAGTAPFQEARVSGDDLLEACYACDVNCSGDPARWKEMLAAALAEVKKARVHGFTDAEIELAKKTVLSGAEQAAQAESTRNTTNLIMSLNEAVTAGRVPMSRAQELELTQRMLPGVTAEELLKSFRADFAFERGVVMMTIPEKEGEAVPTSDELLALAKKALAAEVGAAKTEAAAAPLLEKAPEPAAPTSRSVDEATDVESLVFGNGARVHCRSMDFQKDRVTLMLRFDGGELDETEETLHFTSVAARALDQGTAATARHTSSAFSDLVTGRQIRFDAAPSDGGLAFTLTGTPKDFEYGLQVMYVLLTEAVLEQAAFDRYREQVALQLPEMEKEGSFQADRAVGRLLSGDDPRLRPMTAKRLAELDRDAIQAWLRKILATMPIEASIVGDLPRARMVELASRFVGTLPKRPVERDDLATVRKVKKNKGPFEEIVRFETLTPRADVRVGWRGPEFGERADRRVLLFASLVLSARLNEEIRENRGLTYSIQAAALPAAFDGMARYTIQFTADPAKATEAAALAREIALGMKEKSPATDEEVAAVKSQIANILSTQLQQPAFWARTLMTLNTNERTLDEVANLEQLYAGITKEQVVDALRRYLVEEGRYQVVALPAESAGTGANGK